MTSWSPLFVKTWSIPARASSRVETFSVDIPEDITTLRFHCRHDPPTLTLDAAWAEDHFSFYTQHPDITLEQRTFLHDTFWHILHQKMNRFPTFWIYDSRNGFRGRWDPSFTGWKIVGPLQASDGFTPGFLPAGPLLVELHLPGGLPEPVSIHLEIEGAQDPAETKRIDSLFSSPEGSIHPVQIQWYIGELREHTTRSNGLRSPEETIQAYEAAGYHFLALADHGVPPLETPPVKSGFTSIHAQELEIPYGHALLLGVHEYTRIYPGEGSDDLSGIIYTTHLQGGLFGVAHPFSLRLFSGPSWNPDAFDWKGVDLLEVWPGRWSERFPEILKSFDLWDTLLNQGHRIFGFSGKGSGILLDPSTVEHIPKTLVLSEGLSETQILAALKQGHFYATIEPALALRLESEYGEVLMGDEMKIPVDEPFLLQVDVSRIERGYLKIKTNEGIYCQMPVSSTHETHLKLYERARPGVQWFRLELYRFGQPLDELLAFGNPVFVRGFHPV